MNRLNQTKLIFIPVSIFIIAVLSGSFGCQKNEIDEIDWTDEGLISLGRKLDNPYTVANMQLAYEKIKQNGMHMPGFIVDTTHKYLRFQPRTLKEFEFLENHSVIQISETPYDYEVVSEGYYFHDRTIPKDKFTWLYAVVESDFDLPLIPYQTIDYLYLPPDLETLERSFDANWISFFDNLEHEALKITNNLENDAELRSTGKDKWNPSGYVMIWDDVYHRYIPVEHVEVTARRWFRKYKGITDANGRFECNGYFKRATEYKIVWSSADYRLAHYGNRIEYNGPKIKGEWSLFLPKYTLPHMHATIYKAAAFYYYGDIGELKRPTLSGIKNYKMQIGTYATKDDKPLSENLLPYDYSYSDYYSQRSNPLLRFSIGSRFIKTDQLFGLVIRNMAVVSLINKYTDLYIQYPNKELRLAWGMGVELYLTKKIYPNYSLQYSRGTHPGIVEDLMDSYKTTISYYHNAYKDYGYKEYEDKVSGFNIHEIEMTLINTKTVDNWLNNIIDNKNNNDEENIRETFNYWFYN
jgi:hypothetical protein